MKIVHTADNHLDMPLTTLSYEKSIIRKRERLTSFSKIIDFTISNNADMLLISGDLFHSPTPSSSVVSFCAEQFKRLGNIPVFIAWGNHDYGIENCNFPGNVHIFPNNLSSFSVSGAKIWGISFASPTESFSSVLTPADSTNDINILCVHGDTFSSNSDYNPLNKDVLALLGFDYIALGHIHQCNISPKMAYPGCHDGSGFDENGEKGFLFCQIEKGSLPSITFIPSSSRLYEEICFDISDFSSSEAISRELEESLGDGIYKIILTGKIKNGFVPNAKYIEASLSEKAFFVKVEISFSEDSDISSSPVFVLANKYLNENCDEKTALQAKNYISSALKGDDIF